jgi:hypothetical protein
LSKQIKDRAMSQTIIWNIKGQLNSEYQVAVTEDEAHLLCQDLYSDPEVYGVKALEGEVSPERDGERYYLDGRRVG